MQKKKILIIEDDEDIVEVLTHFLSAENFEVNSVLSGERVSTLVSEFQPDMILLDLMLPGKSGIQICHELKQDPNFSTIPIAILTAKGEEDDIVMGLEAGADDYIVKPFRQRELLARLESILRRSRRQSVPNEKAIAIQGLSLDPMRRTVSIDGEKVDLTFSEFGILQCLMSNPGWVYTRAQIVNTVRGENYFVTDRTVDVQVVGLRKKLGRYESRIETVRGVGYRFADQ